MSHGFGRIKKNTPSLVHIVLAEGEDSRIIQAAADAHQNKIARCTLVGDPVRIEKKARELAVDLHALQIADPQTSPQTALYAQNLLRLGAPKGMTAEQAQQQVLEPLYFADLMLQAGDADGAIAGARYTTGERIRSALKIIGVAPGFQTVSSFMLMILDSEEALQQRMIFADCALVVNPSAEQLAEIAMASTDSAEKLLDEAPRVAMLSFSTHGSASHAMVDKVREATERVRAKRPDLVIDGEIQLDTAIVPAIAAQKMPGSSTQGRANVLIFPDLNAGNIGYKLTQRFGKAKAIGPVMQGLNKPANDLSRGCSVADVYDLISLTALQV